MIPRTAVTVLVLSALTFAACGSDDDAATGDVPAAADLDGRTFEVTESTGYEVVDDSTISIAFEADRLSANAGCNTLNSGFSITDDGTIEVGQMASTMMACDDALMAQDVWLSEFLMGAPAISLADDTLTLTSDDAALTLVDAAD